MAQKTFVDGDVLTASDLNTYLSHEGGAWTTYTPTVSQGASANIAKTTAYSSYARAGRMITWNFSLSMTASGTSGSAVTLTLPVTASSSSAVVGGGTIIDASVSNYAGAWQGASTTTVNFLANAGGAGSSFGLSPNVAIVSGDVLKGSITYEAVS